MSDEERRRRAGRYTVLKEESSCTGKGVGRVKRRKSSSVHACKYAHTDRYTGTHADADTRTDTRTDTQDTHTHTHTDADTRTDTPTQGAGQPGQSSLGGAQTAAGHRCCTSPAIHPLSPHARACACLCSGRRSNKTMGGWVEVRGREMRGEGEGDREIGELASP